MLKKMRSQGALEMPLMTVHAKIDHRNANIVLPVSTAHLTLRSMLQHSTTTYNSSRLERFYTLDYSHSSAGA
jgi:hypothetical protein